MPGKRSSKRSKSSGTKKIKKRVSAKKRPKSASKARTASRTKPKRSKRPVAKSRAKRPATATGARSSSRPKSVRGDVKVSRIAAGATRGIPAGAISKHQAARAAARGKAKMVARAAAAQRGSQGMLELEEGPPVAELVRDPALGPPPMPKKRRKGSQINLLDFPGESLTVGMAAPEFSLPSTL